MLRVADEVREAVEGGRPVVALETTIVAHGFPAGDGLEVGRECEARVRAAGAVPATVAVLDGEVRVGLFDAELERVAPVEQLAEAFGRGWYEEPSAFVDRYAQRVADPDFSFDFAVDDLLVFVEKRPFKTFAAEPPEVPFSRLADPSYRHYRSLAGRASLQARLFALCEAYGRSHHGASVYYDDEQLTIFRFRVRG